MKHFTLIIGLLISVNVFSQEVKRIAINGEIIVKTEDKEGVTVYNTSSNKGTVTDKEGKFTINVALNDVVEFGALQFQDFKVTITDKVIQSKYMTVILVEQVNKLDEVVLLPYGLSGNLNVDTKSVRTYNKNLDDVYFGLANTEDFKFEQDYKSKVTNPAFDSYNPRVEHMLDFVNIAKELSKLIFKSKKKSKKAIEQPPKIADAKSVTTILDTYNQEYYNTNFKIPTTKVEAFKAYVAKQKFFKSTLLPKNKMLFLEQLSQLSTTFLNLKNEKK